jgi:hypothetical protein
MGANAKVLRCMLKLGADPNLPCEAYSYPVRLRYGYRGTLALCLQRAISISLPSRTCTTSRR